MMIYINNTDEPTLLGIIQSDKDLNDINQMVVKLNKDLVDSGYEKYQYQTIRRGDNLYIEQIKGA